MFSVFPCEINLIRFFTLVFSDIAAFSCLSNSILSFADVFSAWIGLSSLTDATGASFTTSSVDDPSNHLIGFCLPLSSIISNHNSFPGLYAACFPRRDHRSDFHSRHQRDKQTHNDFE